MSQRVEREIKLSFDSVDAAREAVAALGAVPLRARRLQDDRLLDTSAGRLRADWCTLRVRIETPAARAAKSVATLTFKGPPRPDVMKVREEVETGVVDGNVLLEVFERAGFEVWFRYQKYREEFECDGTIVAIDETPCGVFVELEGTEAGVTRLAQALGRTPGDYITASYRRVWETDCAARGAFRRRHGVRLGVRWRACFLPPSCSRPDSARASGR